jgi:hypothetical protein
MRVLLLYEGDVCLAALTLLHCTHTANASTCTVLHTVKLLAHQQGRVCTEMPPASARRIKQYYMAVGMTTLNLVPYVPEVSHDAVYFEVQVCLQFQLLTSDSFVIVYPQCFRKKPQMLQ